MPEWAMQLLLAGGGLAALVGAVGKIFNVLHAAWLAKEAHIKELQAKVESQLMDAVAYARENKEQQAERIATDKQFVALASAMIVALERSEATIAKITKDGQ